MTRPSRGLALLPLIAVAVSCHLEEPFARDNHWDPDGDAKKTLTAPESTFAIGDTFSVVLTGDPPLPPGQLNVSWQSTGVLDSAVQVVEAGYSRFVVNRAHSEYQLVTVAVKFENGHVLGKDVTAGTFIWVGQRLANLDVFCGSVAVPVACDATPLTVNATRLLSTTTSDAHGNQLRRRNGAMSRMTVVSRDPAVLAIQPWAPSTTIAWSVRGVSSGATWVVVRGDGVTDSVRVVVVP